MEKSENINRFERITMPDFIPQYKDDTSYGYDRRNNQRDNLKKLLLETSKNHCMYCYRKVVIDNIDYSQIEHAIEKGSQKNNKLRNCVPNLGLSCINCNISFKRKFEKDRMKDLEKRVEYSRFQNHRCSPSSCKSPCGEYKELVNAYHKSKYGFICLKPGITIFPNTGHKAQIQYNIFKGEFEPSIFEKYTRDEEEFILNHINQFNLNDPQKRSDEFYHYCKDVINNVVSCRAYNHYDNYIVDLFIDSVKRLDDKKIMDICKRAYLQAKARGRI